MRRSRNRVWRSSLLSASLVTAVAGAAVLSYGWQIQRVLVEGVQFFDPQQVEAALQEVLGKSPLWASAQELRQKVLTVPWVDDAQVIVELDGTVVCQVKERTPAAVLADETPPKFVDSSGRIIAPARAPGDYLRLVGFGPYPEERQEVLGFLPELEALWGKPIRACERLGARDLAVTFAQEPWSVIMDPKHLEYLTLGKQVLEAARQAALPLPQRVDVRLAGRVFLRFPEEINP